MIIRIMGEGQFDVPDETADALNALDAQTFRDLLAALDAIEADPEIALVILTGRGRAFVAGSMSGMTQTPSATRKTKTTKAFLVNDLISSDTITPFMQGSIGVAQLFRARKA